MTDFEMKLAMVLTQFKDDQLDIRDAIADVERLIAEQLEMTASTTPKLP